MQPASSSAVISECHGKDWIFLSSCKEPANVDYWVSNHMRWGFGNAETGTAGAIYEGQDDFWTPKDQDANTVEAGGNRLIRILLTTDIMGNLQNKSSNRRVQTHYLINAAYLRVKNITLGYTLPKSIVSKIGLSNAKVYCSGEKLIHCFRVHLPDSTRNVLAGDILIIVPFSFGFNLTL